MRTQEKIQKKVTELKRKDLFGFEIHEYIRYLDFEHAKPFLRDNTKKGDWEQEKETPAEKIRGYMNFAWGKANERRGISAFRSLQHMAAWLWLDGQDKFLKKWNNFKDYEYYGKPQLIAICEKYKIDWKLLDDGVRTNA